MKVNPRRVRRDSTTTALSSQPQTQPNSEPLTTEREEIYNIEDETLSQAVTSAGRTLFYLENEECRVLRDGKWQRKAEGDMSPEPSVLRVVHSRRITRNAAARWIIRTFVPESLLPEFSIILKGGAR